MKFFDIIKNDNLEEGHKDSKLKLQCNALMKFVPYEGFYPAVRTVQLVEQFSSSYSERVNFKTSASTIMAAAFGSQVNYKTFITTF